MTVEVLRYSAFPRTAPAATRPAWSSAQPP